MSDSGQDQAIAALQQSFTEKPKPPEAPVRPRAVRSYRPLHTLTWLVAALVIARMALTLTEIAVMAVGRAWLDTPDSPIFVAAVAVDNWPRLIGIPTYLAALVLFFVWLHRAYVNLAPLGSKQGEFTPGMAVGSFFIPLINIVRGYQAVRVLWIESQPLPAQLAEGLAPRRSAVIVGWWWAALAVHLIAAKIVLSMKHDGVDWTTLTYCWTVVDVIYLVIGALFLAILFGVTRRQREQWDDLVRRQPVPPPADRLR